MRHTYIHTTYSSELPFTILFTCPYCGAENRCRDSLRMKGSMPGKIVSKPGGGHGFMSSAQVLYSRLASIERGGYKDNPVQARCGSCQKSPAWANYPRVGVHILPLVLGLLILTAVLPALRVSAHIDDLWVWALRLGALGLLFLSLPLYWIRCRNRDRNIAAMTPTQLPHVVPGK